MKNTFKDYLSMQERQELLLAKLQVIVNDPKNGETRFYKCEGYFREIRLNYDGKQFGFQPDEFVLDQNGILSVCLGVAKSPTTFDGDVLWFFSEGDQHIHFVSGYVPEVVRKNHEQVA